MDKKFSLFLLVFATIIGSCSKDSTSNNNNGGGTNGTTNPYGAGNGRAAFWIRSSFGAGALSVLVDNVSIGNITSYQANGTTCDAAEVKKNLPAGAHSYQVTGPNNYLASGTITLAEGQCTLLELPAPNSTPPPPPANSQQLSFTLQNSTYASSGTQITIQRFNYSNFSPSIYRLNFATGNSGHIIEFSIQTTVPGAYRQSNIQFDNNNSPVGNYWSRGLSFFGLTWYSLSGDFNITSYNAATKTISGSFTYTVQKNNTNITDVASGTFSNLVLP